jgi:hypothetical protein
VIGGAQQKINLEMENRYDALRDSGKVHVLTKPEQEAMLTAEDYMRLAERCAVLARECAALRVAEALRTLALNYLTDATCSAADQNAPVRQHAPARTSVI